jgi:hypothetical protein
MTGRAILGGTQRSRRLLVVARGLLQLVEMREIVLDPELRAGFFDESLHRSPAHPQLICQPHVTLIPRASQLWVGRAGDEDAVRE